MIIEMKELPFRLFAHLSCNVQNLVLTKRIKAKRLFLTLC